MSVSATPQPVSTHNQEMIVDDDDGDDDDMGIFTHLVMMVVVVKIVSIFFQILSLLINADKVTLNQHGISWSN